MIQVRNLAFEFEGSKSPLFSGVNLGFKAGELILLAGETGSGKSTLLRTFNGLVPRYSGGKVTGSILLDGTEVLGKPTSSLSHLICYVPQQAESSFVADTVAEELAFALEQQAMPRNDMIARVEWAAKCVGLLDHLETSCRDLSGGQQQRLAIGAALANGAQVLLLDEPTSELDPETATTLVGLLRDLAKKRGLTIIVAEHKIDRLLGAVDWVLRFNGGNLEQLKPELAVAEWTGPESPLIALANRAGWGDPPLSVAQASSRWAARPGLTDATEPEGGPLAKPLLLEAQNLAVSIGTKTVSQVPALKLHRGEILALIGPNGAGKTSLLWGLLGYLPMTGKVALFESQTENAGNLTSISPKDLRSRIAMVPQTATDLLVLHSVEAELARLPGLARELFLQLVGQLSTDRHPRDLSAGQQLALALAIQLSKGSNLIFLDEPTRGLDYGAKLVLARFLVDLKTQGKGILVASHDLDFVADVSDRCLRLVDGKVVAEGSRESILARLGPEAPTAWQVTKRVLSVYEVHS